MSIHSPPRVSTYPISTSASLFLPCKQAQLYHLSRFHTHALKNDVCFSLSITSLCMNMSPVLKNVSNEIYNHGACVLSCFSHIRLCAILWAVAHQAPLSMDFSRQEYWSGLPCCPPGDLPDSGIELVSLNVCCIGRQVLYHELHLGSLGIKLQK